MKNRIVIASGNYDKIREISEMLPDYEIIGYKDLGLNFEIEETGNSFYDNALLKAKAVSKALGIPALADDSGLSVEALNGAPGIYSARYAGDNNDEHNIDKLLQALKGEKNRRAKFVCAMVIYNPSGEIISSIGETLGEILEKRVGKGGFGYDPVFYSYDIKKSFGECSAEEKNSVSHRYRAIEGIKEKLK